MPHIRCFDFRTVTQLTTFYRLVARAVVPLLKGLIWYELGLECQRASSPFICRGVCHVWWRAGVILVISQNPTSPSRMTVPRIYRVCLDLLLWWEYYISLAWSTTIYNKRCRKWPSGLCCKGELFSTINLCHDYFKKSSTNKFDRRIDSNESVCYYHIIIRLFVLFSEHLIPYFRFSTTEY